MSIRRPATLLTLCALLPLAPATAAKPVAGTPQALTGSTNDPDTPERNATVWVGGCTGTLIQPDMVLTAGHCVNRPLSPLPDGRWFPESLLTNRRITDIRFGPRRDQPRARREGTYFSILNGADIALVALDRPVPARVAVPVPVMTTAPSGLNWSTQTFRQAGWGLIEDETPTTRRRTATTRFRSYPCHTFHALRTDKFCVQGGGVVQGGDSGGPLYWDDSAGQTWLVGVAQGTEPGGGRYVPTFLGEGTITRHDNGTTEVEPDISGFMSSHLDRTACAQVKQEWERAHATIELTSWYSPGRGDNFSSTSAPWMGCAGDRRSPDYRFSSIEGRIYNPGSPAPDGTIPLYRWYSSRRGDNWTTSAHADQGRAGRGLSPGYGTPALMGYIYPPSTTPRAGLVPLYSWYSPSRGDNWLTTRHGDRGAAGQGLSPDYRFVRHEGYVLAP